ncbi:citrate/2-methylcitrate synthase [Kocuria rhizophila]|nr:citrate/2-methylcitrate synthase [Kocuria rhizophila]
MRRTAASVIGAQHPLAQGIPEAELRKAQAASSPVDARRGLATTSAAVDGPGGRGAPRGPGLCAELPVDGLRRGSAPPRRRTYAPACRSSCTRRYSFNASTLHRARATTSTLSDLHSAVTCAIGALKGPLHGGANVAATHTFEELGIRKEVSAEEAKKRAKE